MDYFPKILDFFTIHKRWTKVWDFCLEDFILKILNP